ncbi:hypothetical protein KZ453_10790 [Glaesserella parasuis]|uniref:hypothetical protein n=1 Tax=Glaesserella parasuis TaxID=738 RepID=UPI0004A0FC48|nr:hypothetical protein [Glaesserella parasuis]KDD78919.1 hypothetical protein HPS41_08490 [Glaesserella parasuis ST4-1]KDD79554.1 hypothetical protein HPS42_09500 [Glaesserella parasuis ST4-2]MCT8535259.1 hypothetical protein [Glaesserella parasuis]MCT8561435.1 hypothetical protein [Glaesserella parasuis]MCT8720627.1 hypothetical protein [Glaesserella parasuis]
MKKLLFLLGLLTFNANATEVKIFKEYSYDMHKLDFQKKFWNFGECQFSMGENKLCAERGFENLYGIPFNITVYFDNDRTKTILLKTPDPIDKKTYLELFRGMIKSGFELYEIKDQDSALNLYEEIFNGRLKDFGPSADAKLDKLEAEEKENNSAILYYMEHNKAQQTLKSSKGLSSFSSFLSKLPKDTRFVEMKVNNYKGIYSLELHFTIPNMPITTIDDRPAEKF